METKIDEKDFAKLINHDHKDINCVTDSEIEEEEEDDDLEVNEKFPRSVGFIIGNEFCER